MCGRPSANGASRRPPRRTPEGLPGKRLPGARHAGAWREERRCGDQLCIRATMDKMRIRFYLCYLRASVANFLLCRRPIPSCSLVLGAPTGSRFPALRPMITASIISAGRSIWPRPLVVPDSCYCRQSLQAVCQWRVSQPGPARGDLHHWRYESVDIARHLKAGKNVLAAVVWNFGELAPEAQITNQTGLLV